MNKDLKNKVYNVPEHILNNFNNIIKKYDGDKTVSGYRRALNILSDKKVTYMQLKRYKNFFDKCDDKKSIEYILNGGEVFKRWVNNTLEKDRDITHNSKKVKSIFSSENAFIKSHDKGNKIYNGLPKIGSESLKI
jgi:hypothetical protein